MARNGLMVLALGLSVGLVQNVWSRPLEADGPQLTPEQILELDLGNPADKARFSGDDDLITDKLARIPLHGADNVVRMFVDFEFKGITHMRHHFVRFTRTSQENKEIEAWIEQCLKLPNGCDGDVSDLGRNLDPKLDDLHIVSRYAILGVNTQGDEGTAIIDYDRLATTIGAWSERRVFLDRREHDRVELKLERNKDNQWRVIDPPRWHISIDALAKKCPITRGGSINGGALQPNDDCAVLTHARALRRDRDDLNHLLDTASATPPAPSPDTTPAPPPPPPPRPHPRVPP
ncbi:MAG: hypothetical protein HQL66_12800, partial [Magnetococcales bacterium]|nr:hypothetical protein [Magnetococcales bacterium]